MYAAGTGMALYPDTILFCPGKLIVCLQVDCGMWIAAAVIRYSCDVKCIAF